MFHSILPATPLAMTFFYRDLWVQKPNTPYNTLELRYGTNIPSDLKNASFSKFKESYKKFLLIKKKNKIYYCIS